MKRIFALPIPAKIVENPASGALNTRIGGPSQIVHPYMFGDDASKATGLWIDGTDIRLDVPSTTDWVRPRYVSGDDRNGLSDRQLGRPRHALPRWANQTDTGQNRVSPSPGRATERARTYPGIAKALAVVLLRMADEAIAASGGAR